MDDCTTPVFSPKSKPTETTEQRSISYRARHSDIPDVASELNNTTNLIAMKREILQRNHTLHGHKCNTKNRKLRRIASV